MLVLSRKNGECVCIGDSIEVKVLEIAGGKVKLGFSAPHDVAIQRNEIRQTSPRQRTAWDSCLAVGELCI
jgi:carbon storage regulator